MAMRPVLALLPLVCAPRLAAGDTSAAAWAGAAAAAQAGGSAAGGSPAVGSPTAGIGSVAPARGLLDDSAALVTKDEMKDIVKTMVEEEVKDRLNQVAPAVGSPDASIGSTAPARILIDDSAAMALRMDSNAPWKEDGAPEASQPADASVRVALDAGMVEGLKDKVQQPTQESNAGDLAETSFDCEAAYSNWAAGWSDKKKKFCCEKEQKGCEASEEPQLAERNPADDRTMFNRQSDFGRPHSDAQQKKPTRWILPLAGVFAVLGVVLLAIAGVQKCCRRSAAARTGRPNPVVPGRGRDPNTPLMESEDANMEDDIVSIFEGQVKEARQRAKSLTRKTRPLPVDVAKTPASAAPASPALRR